MSFALVNIGLTWFAGILYALMGLDVSGSIWLGSDCFR